MEQAKSNKGLKEKYRAVSLHLRAMIKLIKAIDEQKAVDQMDLPKSRNLIQGLVYHTLNAIYRGANEFKGERMEQNIMLMNLAYEAIGFLTPRELMQVFPVRKFYDGHKAEVVDYYSSMEVLVEHGLDRPIEKNTIEVLWGYDNLKIRSFMAKYLSSLTDQYEQMATSGLIERFQENDAVPLEFLDLKPTRILDSRFAKRNGLRIVNKLN